MGRNLIFVFVLLATLSLVNSIPHQLYKRTTSFGPCGSNPPPSPISVDIYPDPIVARTRTTFMVHGDVVEDIPAYSVLNVEFLDSNGNPIIPLASADFCSSPDITCPIPGGTKFSTFVQFSVPNDLPASYEIRVSITNPSNPDHDYGCALAAVGFTV